MPAATPDLERLYEAYAGRIRGFAARLIGSDLAEDVTQEVFIKVARSIGTLADPAKVAAWIYAIALNTVRDAVRARAARPATVASNPGQGAPEGGLSDDQRADPLSRTPEEAAIRSEMIACYLDHVRRLPPREYEVYVLGEMEDLTNAEIARRLSMSLGAVKIRLHRARARLHEELRRHCRTYRGARGELMGEPRGE